MGFDKDVFKEYYVSYGNNESKLVCYASYSNWSGIESRQSSDEISPDQFQDIIDHEGLAHLCALYIAEGKKIPVYLCQELLKADLEILINQINFMSNMKDIELPEQISYKPRR